MAGSQDQFGGDIAPTYELRVNNIPVSAGVRSLIDTLEYESVDGMADLLKIVMKDTVSEDGERIISNAKIFQPGNEVDVWFGYGAGGEVGSGGLAPVGRGLIRKVRPIFPRQAAPTVEVICYTRDALMMDNAPEPLREKKTRQSRAAQRSGNVEYKDSKAGHRYANQTFADAVRLKCEDYSFLPDVDATPDAPHEFIHKARMTDYDFVKGLSNLTGYYFWVDYNFAKVGWELHFKNPETYVPDQDKKYTFNWNIGDTSTLLDFEPEMALQDVTTKLVAQVKEPLTGRTLEVKIEDTEDTLVDPIDRSADGSEKLEGPFETASRVKLFIGDFSVEIVTNRRFSDENALALWAQQWFRRQRENFVMSRGHTIGVETLMARQVHTLGGIGIAYDGDYAFNKVRHVFSATSGYECEFNARKIVGELAQLPPVNRVPPGEG